MQRLIERIRRPEYTGERRCWPCTVVNSVILAGGCALLWVAWSVIPAVVLALVGIGAIALRGYLVPYTPQFAPQLVSYLPVDPFHSSQSIPEAKLADGNGEPLDAATAGSLSGTEAGQPAGENLMRQLLESGILVAEGEQLFLAEDLHERWQDAMAELRDLSADDLAARAQSVTPADSVTPLDHDDDWFMLRSEGQSIEDDIALSRPVVIAEVSSIEALEAVVDDQKLRLQASQPLRMFLQRCPVCDVELIETTTVDCCGGKIDPHSEPDDVLACPECNHRLYTFPS